ncbi:MAG: efflux transporter outer membrane subunit [Litoreibacter sp.]|nr:efflux transporter outer membrane subunit [Litoreibacter sp.]
MTHKLIFAVTLASLASCTAIGPDYETPRIDLPTRFANSASQASLEAASEGWWGRLGDPLLNDFVKIGLSQNLSIKSALERIIDARSTVQRTGIPSQLDGGITGESFRTKEDDGTISETSGTTADAAFVFDLFGGAAREREQALANVDAAKFDVGTVRLAYLADLVNSYILARYYQAAASITRQTIESRRQTLDIVQRRRAADEATRLELAQAKSLLATAQASLPVLEANVDVNVFHIATLLAKPAAEVRARMLRGRAQPRPKGGMAAGIPADLLRNRPDVRFAERNLAAATAGVGIAKSRLYPSLRLLGSITTGTDETWTFGPSLSLPILNQPVLQSNVRTASSRVRQAELAWRNSVLTAVEETQAAISLTRSWRRQVGSLWTAVAAAREVHELSRESYKAGAVTLTDVLDAERSVAANRLAYSAGVRDWSSSWVQLQVSTGKGWLAGMKIVKKGEKPVEVAAKN